MHIVVNVTSFIVCLCLWFTSFSQVWQLFF